MQHSFSFAASVWVHDGEAPWHFVTLPVDVAREIDFYFAHAKKGWGSLPVRVRIGQTQWTTSIFPDKRSQSYVLPLKAEVRGREQIVQGSTVDVVIDLGGKDRTDTQD